MRIHQIVPHISNSASGPSYTVTKLCRVLTNNGCDVMLHVLGKMNDDLNVNYPIKTYRQSKFLKRLGISGQMKKGLIREVRDGDIIHNHSVWMMPNIYPRNVLRKKDCQLVFTPRGALSQWAMNRSKWKKRLIWYIGQSEVLKRTNCFHATAENEYEDLRRLGLKAPIAIIPNGVELPPEGKVKNIKSNRKKVLFLSRIHPKKGVDILLKAWHKIQHNHKD